MSHEHHWSFLIVKRHPLTASSVKSVTSLPVGRHFPLFFVSRLHARKKKKKLIMRGVPFLHTEYERNALHARDTPPRAQHMVQHVQHACMHYKNTHYDHEWL